MVEALPDEMIDSTWEVLMPKLNIVDPYAGENSGILGYIGNAVNTYQPIVEAINFGVTNFKTNTRRVRTGWCNVPEDIQNYQMVNITMFCSANMLTQYYLAAWKRLVYDADGEYYNPMSIYKKNIEVYMYGLGNIGIEGLASIHFTLQGCFPTNQEAYKLEYKSEPQRFRVSQNFAVDKVVFDSSVAQQAIITELVTSPTSVVDKAMTTLFNSGSNYSIDQTYGYTEPDNGRNN